MKNQSIVFLIFIASMLFSISCKKENIDKEVIRPIIEFTTADIPAFNDMTQTKKGDIPRGVIKILSDYFTVEYEFRWVSDEDDYAYFFIWVMPNREQAIEALTEMHNYYTNPHIAESKDEPAVVGNVSYLHGKEFIRDNLIVRIHSSEKFDDLVTEIANSIDSKLLESPTYISASKVMPIINDFRININPVIENTQTPLKIQIEDPNNSDIVYQWRFDSDSGCGGIKEDDSGVI